MIEYCRKHMRELKLEKRRQSDPHPKRLSPRSLVSPSLKKQLVPQQQRTSRQQSGAEQHAGRVGDGDAEESSDEMDAFDSSEGSASDDENAEQQRLSAGTVERAPNSNTALVVPYCELVALLADIRASVEALDRLVSTLHRFLVQRNLEQAS
jgi:hypothetical protein